MEKPRFSDEDTEYDLSSVIAQVREGGVNSLSAQEMIALEVGLKAGLIKASDLGDSSGISSQEGANNAA